MDNKQENTQHVPELRIDKKWGNSPKLESIIRQAEQNETAPQQSQEPLDHHSSYDNSQGSDEVHIDEPLIEETSNAPQPDESPIAANVEANDDPEAFDSTQNSESIESTNASIPDWGKKDPIAWEKYQKRMKEKERQEAERKEAEERKKAAEYDRLIQQAAYQNIPQAQQPQTDNIYIDPKTGMPIDITTPEGQAFINEQTLEAARRQYRGAQVAQEYDRIKHQQEQALVAKIEEARFKYKDYDEVVTNQGHKFSQQMIDVAAIITGSNSNQNGADLLYYIAKNPQELNRINQLNPYEQFQVMIKHAIDLNTKAPKRSSAPEPIKPLVKGNGGGGNELNSYEAAKAYMKNKYCKK